MAALLGMATSTASPALGAPPPATAPVRPVPQDRSTPATANMLLVVLRRMREK
jgi:hypothetical protein